MKSKDGLVNQFLSIVIAVIGIFLLVVAGVKLYGFFVSDEKKDAQSFLDGLVEKIELMKDGDENEFLLRGVSEWYLLGYGNDGIIGKDKPEKCSFDSCLCVCPYRHLILLERSEEKCQDQEFIITIVDRASEFVDSCQSDGICRKMDFSEVIVKTKWESKTIIGGPGKDIVLFEDLERGFISLEKSIFDYKVRKEADKLIIEYKAPQYCGSGGIKSLIDKESIEMEKDQESVKKENAQ